MAQYYLRLERWKVDLIKKKTFILGRRQRPSQLRENELLVLFVLDLFLALAAESIAKIATITQKYTDCQELATYKTSYRLPIL